VTPLPAKKEARVRASIVIWLLIALMAVLSAALYPIEGMSIAMDYRGVGLFLLILAVLCGLTRHRYPAAAHIALTFSQIVAFAQAGTYLTYILMAMTPFPLADTALARADAFLGFDWHAWFIWVHDHAALHWILARAYASIPLQLLVLIIYFAFADAERLDELMLGAVITIVLTLPGLIFLPAVGAWTEHGVGLTEPWKHDILALHAHQLLVVANTQGIISFPSFHSACAVLLANMARRRRIFLPILLLNVVMIASVMSEGAHYFVDMLSGCFVAVAAIVITRQVLRWCRNTSIRTGSTVPAGEGGLLVAAIGKASGELPARQ
jgi:membrane-associated phospholipid phosphatase